MVEHERAESRAEEAVAEPAAATFAAPAGPAATVLALQRSAGNRAVGAWLARQDGGPQAAGQDPAKAEPDGITVIVSGVGQFSAESWSSSGANEIRISKQQDETSAKLMQLATTGGPVSLEIRMVKDGKRYLTVRMRDALVTAMNVSGQRSGARETVTFNGKIEFDQPKDRAEGQPDAAPAPP